jgi:hypothetical protein
MLGRHVFAKERLKRAVEPKGGEPPLPGNGLYPVPARRLGVEPG